MERKIVVPASVLAGLEAVRQSGKTNMLDVSVVIELAIDMGFYETALWVDDHTAIYVVGVFNGFDAVGSVIDDGDLNCSERLREEGGEP